MKIAFFIFLLLIPAAYSIAVSPVSLDFGNVKADNEYGREVCIFNNIAAFSYYSLAMDNFSDIASFNSSFSLGTGGIKAIKVALNPSNFPEGNYSSFLFIEERPETDSFLVNRVGIKIRFSINKSGFNEKKGFDINISGISVNSPQNGITGFSLKNVPKGKLAFVSVILVLILILLFWKKIRI